MCNQPFSLASFANRRALMFNGHGGSVETCGGHSYYDKRINKINGLLPEKLQMGKMDQKCCQVAKYSICLFFGCTSCC